MNTFLSPQNSLAQNRWWIFQKERFPVFKYGLLIAIFSGTAVCYSALSSRSPHPNLVQSWLVAFVSVFGFFLQIRIADEFKDFEDDVRYRPDRPVPRGLVTLTELGWLGVGVGLVQLGLAVAWMPQLLFLLSMVWVYFGLMCVEFFARDWLKAHFAIYMLSHLLILPLIALYAMACAGWELDESTIAVFPFLATCFFNGLVTEIGRKIRAPEDEIVGVQTYSALWTPRNAILIWLLSIGGTAIAAGFTAAQVQFLLPVAGLLAALWVSAIVLSYRFLRRLDSRSAAWIDHLSSLWTLVLYLSLGILPFVVQRWGV